METLDDPIRIYALLKRLKEERALLGVCFENHDQEYNSAILDVDLDHHRFTLDELKPKAGHRLLSQRRRCHIKGQTQGVHLEFDATIDKIGEKDGIGYYIAPNPPTLRYMQRRSSVRVPIGAAQVVPVTLCWQEQKLEGELKDLSAGGLGARFHQSLPEELEVGQTLPCTFRSPVDPDEEFCCEINVRLVKAEAAPHEPAFLGCQFMALTRPQQRQLERMVMTLQRQARKRRNDL